MFTTTLTEAPGPPRRHLRRTALVGVAIAATVATAGATAGAAASSGAAEASGTERAATIGLEWSKEFGAGKYFTSPVAANGSVYIGDENGELTKVPVDTGTAGWTFKAFNGIYSTPEVTDQTVFVGSVHVYAINDDSGLKEWVTSLPHGSFLNSPALVGDTLYVSNILGDVAAIDSATGAIRWSTTIPGAGPQQPLLSSPTVLDGKVYLGTFDGTIVSVTPPATAGAAPTVDALPRHWPAGGRITDRLTTDGTDLFAAVNYYTANGVGKVSVVSVTSAGAKRWVRDTGLDASYNGRIQAPTVAGDLVYAPTKTNIAYLDKDTGARTALAETNVMQTTSPTVVDGVAYSGGVQAGGGSSGALQAFDATTGELLFFSRTPTVANTRAAVDANGTVYLGGGNGAQGPGTLWAYEPRV